MTLSLLVCYKDLDEESSDQRNSWFRKEIMNVLKQPYTVTELKELHNEASVHRVSSRHVELRDGTEFSFPTKKKTPSYLDGYPGKLLDRSWQTCSWKFMLCLAIFLKRYH